MKPSNWILALIIGAVMLALVGGCLFLAYAFGPPDVTIHAATIPRDRAFYASAVVASDPEQNCYCYELNTYVALPEIDSTTVNVADENGQVPIFRFDNSVFIVLHKGRNYSRGLALTENAAELADKYRLIELRKLEDGLYSWDFDGQRQLHEPDLYERDLVTPIGG